jgi:hypothetical protein
MKKPKTIDFPDFLEESIELPMPRAPRLRNPKLTGVLPYRSAARLVDLSVAGVGIETFRLLPLHHHCRVELADHPNVRLRLEGTLRWKRLQSLEPNASGETAPLYRCGLSLDQEENDRIQIQSYLNDFAGEPNGSRKPPRFFLKQREAIQVMTPCPFEVRSISSSGALLDIDLSPDLGAKIDLLMDLPDGPSHVAAEVVDVLRRPNSEGTKTQLAVRFLDHEPGDRGSVKKFVESAL